MTQILTKGGLFKGLKQGFELTRERTVKGIKTVEKAYGVTSLSPEQADAARLLELTREHWSIENGLHYRRDVTMGEDACRVRKGAAPEVLAGLRNTVIQILKKVATKNLAAAMRTMNNCFDLALELICTC